MLIATAIDLPKYLSYNISMGKIFKAIVLAALFCGAGFIVFRYGFPWNTKTAYAQLSFISTFMLIIIPIFAIVFGIINANEERKWRLAERAYREHREAEERAYQEQKLKEERTYQEQQKLEERAYQEQKLKEAKRRRSRKRILRR